MSLTVHKLLDFYICTNLQVAESETIPDTKEVPGFIFVLDTSGSMGQQSTRFGTMIMPRILEQVGYDAKSIIHVITFNDRTTYCPLQVAAFGTPDGHKKFISTGCTYMSKVSENIEQIIKNNPLSKNYNILIVSDGELHDQVQTVESVNRLHYLKNSVSLNVQAIRFFTSGSQPETRGLASFLSLSPKSISLLDIPSKNSDQDIINQISTLYLSNFSSKHKLITNAPIFKQNPWSSPNNTLTSVMYDDGIVLTNTLTKITMTNNTPVQIIIGPELSYDNVDYILKPICDKYINYLKLLKVMNTVDTNNEIKNITNFFQLLDSFLTNNIDTSTNANTKEIIGNDDKRRSRSEGIKNRALKIKKTIQSQFRAIIMSVTQIANDNKVHLLNSANMASWLRNLDTSKSSRALARRVEDTNFTEIVRNEIKVMHQHFDEIKDIDPKEHKTSFYNLSTTYDGIVELCETVNSGLVNSMSINDFLQIVNIVGIACNSIIGEYTDPMCYRITKIFPGTFLSISDIIYFKEQGGDYLVAPGYPKIPSNEITNVIPVFDDLRLQQFLYKYCPNLMEYTASVGMRRIISNVDNTYSYTLCGGVWKMIEMLHIDTSTVTAESYELAMATYNDIAKSYFHHILQYTNVLPEPIVSYYINNNGITNMILPLYEIINTKTPGTTMTTVPNILRSAYSFEAAQIIRSYLKKQKDEHDKRRVAINTLNKLLGIDFDLYGTKPQEPLVPEIPNIKDTFHKGYTIDQSLYNYFDKEFLKIDYVAMFPSLFKCMTVNDIKNLETRNLSIQELLIKELEIPYEFKMFRLYTIIQSLLFFTKKDRVDVINKKMKVNDLHNEQVALEMVNNYIYDAYKNYYGALLIKKKQAEKKALVTQLVKLMVESTTINEFVKLLVDGIKYEDLHVQIVNTGSNGFVQLIDALFDPVTYKTIIARNEKITVLFTARYNDNVVWNGSNCLRYTQYHNHFLNTNSTTLYSKIATLIIGYMGNIFHIYRDLPNRQGHHNDYPSFFAYGYLSVDDMYKKTSLNDVILYCELHKDCCDTKRWFEDNKNMLMTEGVYERRKDIFY